MKNLDEFHKHILEVYPQEACGILVEDTFIPLVNIHPDPANNFLLSEEDSFSIETIHTSCIILHSHTMQSSSIDFRTPSHEDMKGQQVTDKLWGIVHCDGQAVSDILYFGKPSELNLLDRLYAVNVFDCFSLARDFYWQHFKILFPTFPKPADWEEWNPYYIVEQYSGLGFIEIDKNTVRQFGDILLFSINSRNINHIGIVQEDNSFIHHLYNRKSCIDSESRWYRQLTKVLRMRNGTKATQD